MIVNDWNEITLDKLKSFKVNCRIREKYDILYTEYWNNIFKKDRIYNSNFIPKTIHHCSGTWRHNIGDCYKNVEPLPQIFNKLENSVVLRGYDDLHNKIPLLKNSDDIDLLLSNKDDIVNICGDNIIKINNEAIKFDRRYIGDNYYDKKWQETMIRNKIKHHFFYIMDETNNYYATLYHSLIHKGFVHDKYNNLYKTYETSNNLKSDILSRYYNLLYFMFNNDYKFVRAIDTGVGFFKNYYNLNLFIIRKKGMQLDIVEYILGKIELEYQIIDRVLVNINNKQKFYKQFYGNFNDYKDDILASNDNQCLAIITNNPKDKDSNKLKTNIRKKYIGFYPPLGNIIHCSDSSDECEKELQILFDKTKSTFYNIGTYYSQMSS